MSGGEGVLLPENGFAAVLHQAWLQAGQPSMRALARLSNRSAQMVNSTLRGDTLPRSWEVAARMMAREAQLREAARQGSRDDLWALAGLLEGTGRIEEAEAVWQEAAETGEAEAMWRMADLLVSTDRLEEAELWWRRASDTDSDTGMMSRLSALIARAGRVEDADRLIRFGRDPDGSPAEPWYDPEENHPRER